VAQLPRGSRWENVGLAVHSTESKEVACDFAISAHASTDGPLTDKLTLPLPLCHVGLARTGPVEAYAAPPTSPPLPPPSLPCKENPQSSSVDPQVHIGATGPESIGATGATHVQLGLDSRHSLVWILSLGLSAGSPEEAAWKGMVITCSVFLVLGASAAARAVAHNSFSRLSGYGSTVLLSGLCVIMYGKYTK
jgi:hypothetical protein